MGSKTKKLTLADKSCPHCNDLFSRPGYQNLFSHPHLEDGKWCANQQEYREYLSTVNLGRKCDQCDNRYYAKAQLEKHRLIHKSCHICYEVIPDKTDLNRHLLSHYQLEVGPCPVCHEVCSNQEELLQHLRTMHTEHLNAIDKALWEKYPHSKMYGGYTKFEIPEILDCYGAASVHDFFALHPPTDEKNNNLGNSSSLASFLKTLFRSFSCVTEKIIKAKVDLSDVKNIFMKSELKKASNDMPSRESTSQNISSNSVEKSKIFVPKRGKSQLPSINQLQNIPIVSTPTARLPKVIIGETLNNFQDLNTPEDINAFVPVDSDLDGFQHSLSNRKIVKVSPKCMKVLKESLLKDSPATNYKHVCVAVPSKMLKQLELLPSKSEREKNVKSVSRTSTITVVKRKESDEKIQTNVEKKLQEDRRRKDEKEKIKKTEKILRKMLMKYEEKEEKKLIKYFQKYVAYRIEKKQGHLSRIDKRLVDAMGNKTKLLEVIRHLKCKDQSDVGRLLEHFGLKLRPKNYTTGEKQAVCRRDRKVVKKGKSKTVC